MLIESKEIEPDNLEASPNSNPLFLDAFETLENGLGQFLEHHPVMTLDALSSSSKNWGEILNTMAEVRVGLDKLLDRLEKTNTKQSTSTLAPQKSLDAKHALETYLDGLSRLRDPLREALNHPELSRWSKSGIKPTALIRRISQAALMVDDMASYLKATGIVLTEMDLKMAEASFKSSESPDGPTQETPVSRAKEILDRLPKTEIDSQASAERLTTLFVEIGKSAGFPKPYRIDPSYRSSYLGLVDETLYFVDPNLFPNDLFQHCASLLNLDSTECLIVAQKGDRYRLSYIKKKALTNEPPKAKKTTTRR